MDNYERLQEIGKGKHNICLREFPGSYGSVYKIRRKQDGKILVWKELDYGRMSEREKQ
jgi:NIMA (never in mitosis gene a)-related kinase